MAAAVLFGPHLSVLGESALLKPRGCWLATVLTNMALVIISVCSLQMGKQVWGHWPTNSNRFSIKLFWQIKLFIINTELAKNLKECARGALLASWSKVLSYGIGTRILQKQKQKASSDYCLKWMQETHVLKKYETLFLLKHRSEPQGRMSRPVDVWLLTMLLAMESRFPNSLLLSYAPALFFIM